MESPFPLEPAVDMDGLDDFSVALARDWVHHYHKIIDTLSRVSLQKPIQGEKWCEGMQRHYIARLCDMLDNKPDGVIFLDR